MNPTTRIVRLLLVVPLLVGALAMRATAPAAAAQECGGAIANTTIKDVLVVPTGVDCDLFNVVVRGGIDIQPGGGLLVYQSNIQGAITGSNVLYASITYSTVRGSVRVSGIETLDLAFAEVRGNLVFSGATDRAFLQNATVRGNTTLNDNGLVTVQESSIGGTLSCKGNDAVTNVGTANSVGGKRLGQCQDL